MFRTLLICSLTMTVLLCGACADLTKWRTEIDRDFATVSKALTKAEEWSKATSAQVAQLKADLDAKLDKARADFTTMGAPVDGTAAQMLTWAAKNPGMAATDLTGFALIVAGAAAGYKRKKNKSDARDGALNAVVDTIDGLPPDKTVNKADLLLMMASHPQMDGDAKLAVAEVSSR